MGTKDGINGPGARQGVEFSSRWFWREDLETQSRLLNTPGWGSVQRSQLLQSHMVHFFWEGTGMGRHSREPGGGRKTKEKSKPSPATQGSDYKVPRAAKGTEIGVWGCGRTEGRLVGHMHGSTQWSGLDVDSRGLARC